MLAVLALVLGACADEEESQCRAACSSSLEVALLQEEWTAGAYVLVARYDAHRTSYVTTCTFTLPGGEDALCDDGSEQVYGPQLSVGAAVTLGLTSAPDRIELELQPPEGDTKSIDLEPEYETFELCGQTCGNGFTSASFDDMGSR
jgi:hypothetical protein